MAKKPMNEDLQQMLEDLKVHQIELEMQNEELRTTRTLLEESRDRYADLYDFAPVGYASLDTAGVVREINLIGARLLGVERSRLINHPFAQYVLPADRPKFSDHLRRCLESHEQVSTELSLLGPGARTLPVQLLSLQIRDATRQGPIFRTAINDMSERRLAAETLRAMEKQVLETQKLESLGLLAGGIAHDFNNIISTILGYSNLCRMGLPADSAVQPYLANIEKASQRAAALCQQLLAYSGRGRFLTQRLDLSELVRKSVQLLELSVSKKAKLVFHLAEKLPAVLVDATQIHQIVMNLVINASEAIGERGGQISVSTSLVPQAAMDQVLAHEAQLALPPGAYVRLDVSDNGGGIKPADLKKIFDPFFTTKFTGRGLGLAAVHGIVQGHKGGLVVKSAEGKGSTFSLFLPVVEGKAEKAVEAAGDWSKWKGKGTVLVADDDEAVRPLFESMLRDFGFDVILARDGKEAVRVFTKHHKKLTCVLLDLTMPRLDGVEALRVIRRINPAVPVLMMSGYNEQDLAKRFKDDGPDGFIEKPFTVNGLRKKMFDLVGMKS